MGNERFKSTAWLRAAVAMAAFFALLSPSGMAGDRLEDMAKRAGVRILTEGTSDKDVLKYTKSRIPWSRMSPASRQRASEILNDLSQFRRMPSLQYRVDTGIYQYLISHPDVAVSTWRVMGISKLEMLQTGNFEYEASAADGSEGNADVLWRDHNQCLFIVEGKYTSPLLPGAIHASALVWLQYRFVTGQDGTRLVNQQVETFIHFPSGAVDTVARMASRVTNTILDRNVFEVSLYAKMMSQAAEKEPQWIEQVAERMEGVHPQRRLELVQVARGQKLIEGQAMHVVPNVSVTAVSDPQLAAASRYAASRRAMPVPTPYVVRSNDSEELAASRDSRISSLQDDGRVEQAVPYLLPPSPGSATLTASLANTAGSQVSAVPPPSRATRTPSFTSPDRDAGAHSRGEEKPDSATATVGLRTARLAVETSEQ